MVSNTPKQPWVFRFYPRLRQLQRLTVQLDLMAAQDFQLRIQRGNIGLGFLFVVSWQVAEEERQIIRYDALLLQAVEHELVEIGPLLPLQLTSILVNFPSPSWK
jgi:hypothetical protein